MSLFENPVCVRHCTQCEGQDHHWMEDCDDDTGEPIMVCKHCDKQRPWTAAEIEGC